MTRIVCTVGYPGAGKTSFSRLLSELRSASVVSTGDALRQLLVQRGYAPSLVNMIAVSDLVRREYGGQWMRLVLPTILEALRCSERVVVDSIREVNDLVVLREHDPQLLLVAISATAASRELRLATRQRPGDPVTRDERLQLQQRHNELGLDTLIKQADVIIPNVGTAADLRHHAAAFVKDVLSRSA